MGIFENTVLVDRKISAANTIGRVVCVLFFVLFLVLSFTPLAPVLFFAPAVIVAVIFYFLHMETQVEYEYTYIEGRLSFAKITAKRKRKELARVEMEEMILLAPQGNSQLHTYHSGPQKAIWRDYTSGNATEGVYEVVYKVGEGIGIIQFEPDRNMLQLMQPRNMRKVIID